MTSNGPSSPLSFDKIDAIVNEVAAEAKVGRKEAAWLKAQPLRRVQAGQSNAAMALLFIVSRRAFEREAAIEALSEIARSHDTDVQILSSFAECLEAVCVINDLNSAPPGDAIFRTVVERLEALAKAYQGRPEQDRILWALAQSARIQARQFDAIAESSYRKLIELNPRKSADHYNLGLFCKTRGRFEEGVAANQLAASLSGEVDESCEWNLGICATGAGNAALALDVWKRMGERLEIGRFGLPEGRYSPCKVKLAERPLAERTADNDDPGAEETVWIERLSPCHGIIRGVLYGNLGVDYGDVILIDGAPITHHRYGEQQVPVFPHLATLLRRHYQFYDFAGTQDAARELADITEELDGDAVVYSHSEDSGMLCANCWRDPDLDHDRHEQMQKHIVTGRIAAPPDMPPAQLLDLIDKAIERRGRSRLYAPDLCVAAGQAARARSERRRFDLLRDAPPG